MESSISSFFLQARSICADSFSFKLTSEHQPTELNTIRTHNCIYVAHSMLSDISFGIIDVFCT